MVVWHLIGFFFYLCTNLMLPAALKTYLQDCRFITLIALMQCYTTRVYITMNVVCCQV